MLSRRLVRRVLIVSPAGLVGNWERELRSLFRLQFQIIGGADARTGNPFHGPESDRIIVSLDTLTGTRMFHHFRDTVTKAYDLVVFDETHKLAAHRQPDFRIRKTDRYRLAEAVAGAEGDDEYWTLPWTAQHLLLLTATPHMGKDYPYYCLWCLLWPRPRARPTTVMAASKPGTAGGSATRGAPRPLARSAEPDRSGSPPGAKTRCTGCWM